MAGWATASERKMLGGYGLYREGRMFALIVEDELFLKADANNARQFGREGSRPFAYRSQDRAVQLSYWSAPADSIDLPAEIGEWRRSPYGAALLAQTVKPGKSVKRKQI